MYEIPPSVDRYLKISSKSMIHFPTVSLESSLSPSLISGDETARDSPKKLFDHFESLAIANGKYLTKEETARKRGCDECDKEIQMPSKKIWKGDHEEEDFIDCTNIEPHHTSRVQQCGQLTEPTVEKDPNKLNKPSITNGHTGHTSRVFTRRLPEIKPKIAGEVYKYDETAWQCNNGRTTTRKNPWGPQSYSELISGAIRSSPGHRASLQQIYDWIVGNIPWFHDKADYPSTKGWKNAIRHTLSIRKRFTRIVNDRSPHASLWTFSRHGYRSMTKY